MDSITILIKNEIKKQYGSIKKFSEASGIPYSTLSNALTKGIGGTAYSTVIRICELLNIKQTNDEGILLLSQNFYRIYSLLSQLDEQGIHVIETILKVEYDRCQGERKEPSIKSFNGIGLASNKLGGQNHEE